MSDASSTTIGEHLSDAAHRVGDAVHDAISAASDKAHQFIGGLSFSKPAAEVAEVADAVFRAALPMAIDLGEHSMAAMLTPEHFQQIATLVGEINATIVKQYLARVAIIVATAPK